MIISHKHKFIFIAINRTASQSIQAAFKLVIPLRTKNYNIYSDDMCPEIERYTEIERHTPAKVLKDKLGNKIWNSYFTFAFSRNPWDWLVSIYLNRRNHPDIPRYFPDGREDKFYHDIMRARSYTFKEYIIHFTKNKWPNQLALVRDGRGIIVDYIGRYERLNRDFSIVCYKLGFKNIKLPHIGKTKNRRHYSYYYDDETKELVKEYWRQDIDYFGYKFEN